MADENILSLEQLSPWNLVMHRSLIKISNWMNRKLSENLITDDDVMKVVCKAAVIGRIEFACIR
jgi:hypothetical protein